MCAARIKKCANTHRKLLQFTYDEFVRMYVLKFIPAYKRSFPESGSSWIV